MLKFNLFCITMSHSVQIAVNFGTWGIKACINMGKLLSDEKYTPKRTHKPAL